VTDPDGNHLDYAYDPNGDLVSVKDREEKETTFTYFATPAHLLDEIRDPLGRTPIKNEYDPSGRLVAHTDAFGKRIEYTHSIGTRQETIKDRNDKIRLLEYDERGNVVKETQPDGKQIVRTFDGRNNRTSETEPHEPTNPTPATTFYVFDATDNLLSMTDANNDTTEYTYNARKQVLTTKDARGRFTVNAYDTKGSLFSTKSGGTSLSGPFLSETTNTYDTAGNPLTTTTMVGGVAHTTTNTFDAFGRLLTTTDAENHQTSFSYDGRGNRLTETTTRTLSGGGAETLVRTFEYDRNGRPTKAIDPDNSYTRTVYDEFGRRKESYDKLNHKTAFEYDANGRLVKITFPDLTTEESGYDFEGRRTSSKDRRGKTTLFAYDDVGRLTTTTHPDTTFTTNGYDAAGRLVSVTDERGKTTQYRYDAAGRRTKVIDANLKETVFTYDASGNLKTTKDPLLRTTTYEYDDLNRKTKTIFHDATFAETGYDELGRRTSEKDQLGRTTGFAYDKVGRLVKVTDANLKETVYQYDELGNKTLQRDARSKETRFEYDKLGRETKRTLPGGSFESKTYDLAGNLKTRTDFMGRVTTYDYDQNNRLTSRTYPNAAENVSFTYTASGRRETETDASGVTGYLYDDRDRVTRKTAPDGRRLEYGWDGTSNRTSLTAVLAGGATTLATTSTWDNLNRLETVTDPQSRVTSFTYDDNSNRLTASYPNGVATSWGYDTLNRLTSIGTTRPASGTTILSYALTLGSNGRREQVVESDGTTRGYGYDNLDRLTRETVTELLGPLYEKTWTYDDVGNRLTQTTTGAGAGSVSYSYDDRDRLLLENATSNGYDDNGNLTTKSGDQTLTWDHENRLIRVTKADGSLVEHGYDVDGNRVRATTTPAGGSATTVDYLVDTSGGLSHVVAETDGAGALQSCYVRGIDDLISVTRPGGSRWIHTDHLGSVRRLTDENGLLTDGLTFDAWGVLTGRTGTDPLPYRFAGEPFDETSRLSYHRARWMDPGVGRFTGMDPFGGRELEPATLHNYLYAHADPANRADPTGLFAELSIAFAVGSMVSTLAQTSSIQPTAGRDPFLNPDSLIERIPTTKPRRQLAGIIFAESSSVFSGGENADEKLAIGQTIGNRTHYATLRQAAPTQRNPNRTVACANSDFGDGTVFSAIRAPNQFAAYRAPRWNKVMQGDDLKPRAALTSSLTSFGERMHFNFSVLAAEQVVLGLAPTPGLSEPPIAFRSDSRVPGSPDRWQYMDQLGSHYFFSFIAGRECR
jgi:RHS repeat-associated protein